MNDAHICVEETIEERDEEALKGNKERRYVRPKCELHKRIGFRFNHDEKIVRSEQR